MRCAESTPPAGQRCKLRGDTYLSSKADAIAELETQQAAGDTRAKAEEKLQALLAPINDIFEKRLKPELDKLPTRAQRAAALKRDGADSGQR